jgi:hypothetical protein
MRIPGSVRGIERKRATEIIVDYVGAFLESVFCGKEEEILKGPSKEFPEVVWEFRGWGSKGVSGVASGFSGV